ncbi:DUF6970 domain-containing protein [Fulvivirga kasyanovii]|uniref:DUF6970 domain-containing protein n=1 Tax=Fulvivirga kasyanovii TaxID=396812 RepID=A0ABW9RPW5_9BACT|nr:hypothetical protein [Fulvivirga kasyanovii]MTI26192.1 hypothetical protein [Fulvivirga kasyanovii]
MKNNKTHLSRLQVMLFCVAVLLSACKTTNAQTAMCYIEDPIAELGWLQDIIQRQKSLNVDRKADIFEYTFKGEKYFMADMCVGCPDFITVFYNCIGEKVCESGGIMGTNTCPDFEEEAISKRLIWSSYRDIDDY